MLAGSGKRMRHVKVSGAEFDAEGLRALILAAYLGIRRVSSRFETPYNFVQSVSRQVRHESRLSSRRTRGCTHCIT